MPLPESSLSILCSSIVEFIGTGVDATSNDIIVSLGAPAKVKDGDDEDKHKLNLFFYRFEPYGFDSSTHPNDPWRLRLFCLITAFGMDDEVATAGENDLRILGEVMRIFRQTPVMAALDVNGEEVRIQVVFSPVTDEQINQVWSTQGDKAYRPSVIYELALAPIVPTTPRPVPQLVGMIGTQAHGSIEQRFAPFTGVALSPIVNRTIVNTRDPQWAPVLSWVFNDTCAHTLSFDVESDVFADFTPLVWVAGDTGESVNLVWQRWTSTGWLDITTADTVNPYGVEIDPDNIPRAVPGVFPDEISLPFILPAGEDASQLLLYASRTVTLIPGNPSIEVRSNPLLINLYRSS